MGKLAFWKKEDIEPEGNDEFDLQKNMMDDQHPDLANPFSEQQQQEAFNPNQPFDIQSVRNTGVPPASASSVNTDLLAKNIELISVKIDSLKSELENMNQRLMNIEAIAKREQHTETNRRYPQW